jgi:hypothetical protein
MKLLFHSPGHPKNTHAIQQMCSSVGWDCEFTTSDTRLRTADYDIVIMNTKYISPEEFPPHVKIIYGPQYFIKDVRGMHGSLRTELLGKACYNCLSAWNIDAQKEMTGEIAIPLTTFPYSVDVSRFAPDNTIPKTLDCLLYFKHRDKALLTATHTYLQSKGYSIAVYIYGSYREDQYLADLRRTKFMVVIDAHESQGFALEEAMSCNVPLFVIDATSMYDELNGSGIPNWSHMRPKHLYATSVPYWSDKCGLRITTLAELPTAFEDFSNKLEAEVFQPRDYVLETLSPIVCMRRILDYFHIAPM